MQKWFLVISTFYIVLGGAVAAPSVCFGASGDGARDVLPTGESRPEDALAEEPLAVMGRAPVPAASACHTVVGPVLRTIPRETSHFGLRFDPLGEGWRLHAGVDLAAPTGSSVLAASRGEVLRSGWARGYGNLVVVDHGGGMTTRYAHLERSLVRSGEDVASGQLIGLVGSTGHATGSHLHFEVRMNGRAVDPDRSSLPFCGFAMNDAPRLAPALPEVHERSNWTHPYSDGQLPSIVIR